MSDIPVGSPPAPPGRHAAPSGWYPDPVDPRNERYWDGWQWGRDTRVREHSHGGPAYPPVPSGPPTGHPPQRYGQPGNPRPPLAPPGPYGWQPYPYQKPPSTAQMAGAKMAFTSDGVPLSSWWWRVLAAIVDSILVTILATLPSIPIYRRLFAAVSAYVRSVTAAAQRGDPAPPMLNMATLIAPRDQLLLTLTAVLVGLGYHTFFLRWKAATPGKMMCGLRVVPVDFGRSSEPIPLAPATIRSAIWVLPGLYTLLVFFRLLDALFPLWHPKRQAIHDLAAKTQVVKIR